jgi:hypothetical protein
MISGICWIFFNLKKKFAKNSKKTFMLKSKRQYKIIIRQTRCPTSKGTTVVRRHVIYRQTKEGKSFVFVCHVEWDLPNHGAFCCTLGTIGKPFWWSSSGALSLGFITFQLTMKKKTTNCRGNWVWSWYWCKALHPWGGF